MSEFIYTTDCEGPTCLNDNAYEVCAAFLPEGERTFNKISLFDDIVYLLSSKGEKLVSGEYGSGNTLKFVLPFLKAYGLTDRIAQIFSEKLNEIIFTPDAKLAHKLIKKMDIPVFEVSTSYQFFAHAVSKSLKIPSENVFCTRVELDKYFLPKCEKERLKEMHNEVRELPDICVPKSEFVLEDLNDDTRHTVGRLIQMFCYEIMDMRIGELLRDVEVVDAHKKVHYVEKSMKRVGKTWEAVLYVGDSITDKEVFRYVNQGGGIAISFNGDRYAIDECNLACIGNSALGLAALVKVVREEGKQGVMEAARNWSPHELKKHNVDLELVGELFDNGRDFQVFVVEDENKERLIQKSESKAKSLKKKMGLS